MAKRNKIVGSTWGNIQKTRSTIFALLIFSGIIYIIKESKTEFDGDDDNTNHEFVGRSLSQCNLFDGKWIYDNKSHPLYKEKSCTYQYEVTACEKFGRKDSDYQHWRWQPHNCDIPKFDPKSMLERLRGKRLVFVGDSIGRNQFGSMICLLESSIAPSNKSVKLNGNAVIFEAKDYNATVEHYWAPFLVESNYDDPLKHHFVKEPILRTQEIKKHAEHWTDADILVFNTYNWWWLPNYLIQWGSNETGDAVYKRVDTIRTLEMALQTWSDWLEINIDQNKTKVYFMSSSPEHKRGESWGKTGRAACLHEKEPIFQVGYHGNETNPKIFETANVVINKLKRRGLQIQILDITRLSELRKDAHTGNHWKYWKNYIDCIHWCLPGLPDVWNELLYAYTSYL